MGTQNILTRLIEGNHLSVDESQKLMECIIVGYMTPVQIASVLTALRMKGESVDEIVGFIKALRANMLEIKTTGVVIDTCGTGGDGKGTFNISTASALVVAGAGVKVAKHGNRNASSLCGSADVLEALGVNINLKPQQAQDLLANTNFTFLFAPLYHPAFKFVAPVRRELKIRTVFNFLGPFLNPAIVKRQIIGVPNLTLAEKLARAAIHLNYDHLMIVSSFDGLDEISLSSPTYIFELKGSEIKKTILNPRDLGFVKISLDEIKGGDAKANAQIIKRILDGEKSARKDIVLINAAAALFVAGKVSNISNGLELARESISSGKAKKVLQKLISFDTQK